MWLQSSALGVDTVDCALAGASACAARRHTSVRAAALGGTVARSQQAYGLSHCKRVGSANTQSAIACCASVCRLDANVATAAAAAAATAAAAPMLRLRRRRSGCCIIGRRKAYVVPDGKTRTQTAQTARLALASDAGSAPAPRGQEGRAAGCHSKSVSADSHACPPTPLAGPRATSQSR